MQPVIHQHAVRERAKKASEEAIHEFNGSLEYVKQIKKRHQRIAKIKSTLLALVDELKILDDDKDADEIEAISEHIEELQEDLINLKQGNDLYLTGDTKNQRDLDQIDFGEDHKQAIASMREEFISKYCALKVKSGFKTQEQVAQATGIDRRVISRIETGKSQPQFKTMEKLAKAFGVDVSYFFNAKENKK